MKRLLIISILILLSPISFSQVTTFNKTFFSKNVADSFKIYFSIPVTYTKSDTYKIAYYLDAGLKSGCQLREMLSVDHYNDCIANTLFIGIAQIGNYHKLRRRDFILPEIHGTDTTGRDSFYGQAEKFYAFLKSELIPYVNSQFITYPDSNSILGHSLGGLFVFYCLFRSENLFSRYFALSPALWIDHQAIYKFNQLNTELKQLSYLYFASGSLERFNKILRGTKEMKKFLDNMKYENLLYEFEIQSYETHNTAVVKSLDKILKQKL